MKDKFKEGMKFDSEKKLRFELIPVRAFEEIVKVFTLGAKKYEDRNWERGLKWGRVLGACMRHLWAFWRGEEYDSEFGLSHLAHAACDIIFLLHYFLYYKKYRQFDDRPKYIENRLKTRDK